MVKFVYKTGNLLDDDADVLVNCVNSHTAYGGGLAGQFAERFPESAEQYERACELKMMNDDNCAFYTQSSSKKWVANILTMTDDMKGSYYRTLKGLKHLSKAQLKTIAIPPCGCGIGGLDIDIIHKEILYIFRNFDGEVRLYNFKEEETNK